MPDASEFVASVPLRVRFSETDAMGVANNGAYVAWLEVGRIEYLRQLGHSYRAVHDGGLDLVVAGLEVAYLVPLRFDDEFQVDCWCSELRRASFAFSYRLHMDGRVHATGRTRHACVDRAGMRPTRLPDWLTQAVSALTDPS